MRPNPAELAAWTRANARARTAYHKHLHGHACRYCDAPLTQARRRVCDTCLEPKARPPKPPKPPRMCPRCKTTPLAHNRQFCTACLVPKSVSQARYKAKKKVSQ